MRIAPILLVALASCRCASAPSLPAKPAAEVPLATRNVILLSHDGPRFSVHVEIADNDATREKGLMYRRSLGHDDGMLFVFPTSSDHTFWMRNTLIPLDMLFIASDGTIEGIVADATPETDTPRSVQRPSQYVLEVNSGWCAEKGIAAGDRVVRDDLPSTAQ